MTPTRRLFLDGILAGGLAAAGCFTMLPMASAQGLDAIVTEQEAQAIGVGAYVYPLLSMDITRKSSRTSNPARSSARGRWSSPQ